MSEIKNRGEDPKAFLSQAAMAKRAEVSMRNASPELKSSMKEAKSAEIKT